MTHEMPNKLEREVDGAFELLDRQLIDIEGRFLGKVDDVELTQTDRGLTITALLTGQVALLHRLGGQLGNEMVAKYVLLRPSETNRSRPWRIPIENVDRLDSAVHLEVTRDESVIRDMETFRLGTLTGMDVTEPDGQPIGRVLDARFTPDSDGTLVMRHLVIGDGRPGTLLGYDRRPHMGPWILRKVVGAIHRHTRLVGTRHLQVLWNKQEVRLLAPRNEVSASPSLRA
jgi:sporulation protein YlmC with PRC-barrel domain